MPAVTGRTRRRFAPALGSGKNAAAHKTACTTRVCRGGSLLCGWGAFRLSASWLCQDEDSLFIAQDLGEVKRENFENLEASSLLNCTKSGGAGGAGGSNVPKFDFIH